MKREIKFLDSPRNIRIILVSFFAALGFLLIVDPFTHKHGYFPFEDSPGFFAAYGFAAYVLIVWVAMALRLVLKRKETYYEDETISGQEPDRGED